MGSLNTTNPYPVFEASSNSYTIPSDFRAADHQMISSSVIMQESNDQYGFHWSSTSNASATLTGPAANGDFTLNIQAFTAGNFRAVIAASWEDKDDDVGGEGDPIIKTFDGKSYRL